MFFNKNPFFLTLDNLALDNLVGKYVHVTSVEKGSDNINDIHINIYGVLEKYSDGSGYFIKNNDCLFHFRDGIVFDNDKIAVEKCFVNVNI